VINKAVLILIGHHQTLQSFGMGEPPMNYNNMLASIDKITSDEGL
jgi:adenine C2-methylase RlmN of 23S rRNA A2503 and tRNA A37